MRETSFIRQNKDKWQEFEKHLASDKKDPDKLSNLFVQITDDLSYSRTFYPNRSVRVYLNNIAQKVFQSIYRNRTSKRRRFAEFWKDELPATIWESRKELLLSFVLFWGSFFIGVFSCMQNPEFPRMILGDAYVDMTLE
ncbi:MAG: stage II sporulation protein M, partial [Bacteroidota bacterium]